ncbi:flagellar hook-associated protein Fla [Clostridium aceticum]|uniref:Flagellin n=1 Tax=Clostridium aceticum TaxID=84022 RepID=A0A0D8I6K7_9CLOT|nr:flagellin [Clostridium aceticum]AKL93831.1 flagellar hook-associated protein Fla [Clostridium aceticum]KJF25858.1 hypothetical protein TZ02_16850 [Clostridium aceticum]
MRINHNIPALNAHRLLSSNTNASSKVLERLSSGKKINKAADDAAGMAISEKMRAQVRGLKKASQNTLDGISLIQTAEGAMNEVHSMLQRMRELAVQSANGTVTDADRRAIQDEINQLTCEVNRIANGTEFNTRNILRGNEAPNANTTVHRMSTGAAATFNTSQVNDVAAEWNTGKVEALGDGGTGTFSFNGVTVNINAAAAAAGPTVDAAAKVVNITLVNGSTGDAATAAAIISALSAYEGTAGTTELDGFTFSGDVNGIIITGDGSHGVTNNNLRISVTGDVEIANTNITTRGQVAGKAFVDDAAVAALGDLTSQQLSIWIDGKERVVILNKLDGTALNATKDSLLEAFNNAMGDLGQAIWNDNNQIEIKTTSIGGGSEVKLTGTTLVLENLFGTSDADALRTTGIPEKDTGEAKGSFYFNDTPEIGSTLTIGDEKIEFFDSRVGPYTGSNRPINLSKTDGTTKNLDELVAELADLGINGAKLSQDPNIKERLIVTANDTGFKGQAIFIEGTPKEFVTNLQIGPNQGQGFRLSVGDIRAQKLGISAASPEGNTGVKGAAFRSIIEVTDGLSEGAIEYAIDVSTEERATAAITVYDDAIIKVASLRGALGAIQNRLEYTAANLDNTTENLTAALSRIEDADMALEMSEFTKLNILMQAGTAMLAQANQRPQSILQLLGS